MNKETLFSIRYLRTLDVPLPEIADFLRNRNPWITLQKSCANKSWPWRQSGRNRASGRLFFRRRPQSSYPA